MNIESVVRPDCPSISTQHPVVIVPTISPKAGVFRIKGEILNRVCCLCQCTQKAPVSNRQVNVVHRHKGKYLDSKLASVSVVRIYAGIGYIGPVLHRVWYSWEGVIGNKVDFFINLQTSAVEMHHKMNLIIICKPPVKSLVCLCDYRDSRYQCG